MRFIFDRSIIIPPLRGTVEPTRFVPAPLGVTGILFLLAYLSISLTSFASNANTSASAKPLRLFNASLRYSSGISEPRSKRFLSVIIFFSSCKFVSIRQTSILLNADGIKA